MNHQYEIEMSITHHDFFRLLPFALKNLQYEISHQEITIHYADGEIVINLGKEKERKIASLVLPVVQVHFTYSGIISSQFDNFLVIFNKAYQRGGG